MAYKLVLCNKKSNDNIDIIIYSLESIENT